MSQRINLNTTPNQFMPILYFSQGDIGRTFEIALTSSDGYSIPIGATVEMVATKPSGFGFTVSGSLTGNVATFVTTETMTSEWGRFPAEIVIKNNGDVIGTANFYLNGERNPHPEGTIDGDASTIIPQLTLLVERVETAASSVLDRQTVTQTLPAGSQASYSFDEETNTQTFGIPQGEAGAGAVDVTASAYSSSKTYAVGDYVIHNDYLYRCTTAITTAEAWTSGHWTQVLLGDEVSDVKADLNDYVYEESNEYTMTVGGYIHSSNGGITENSDWSYSNYIDINATGIVSFYSFLSGFGSIAFYDKNKTFISSDSSYGAEKRTPTIPNNAVYVRFCNRDTQLDPANVKAYTSYLRKTYGTLDAKIDTSAETIDALEEKTMDALTLNILDTDALESGYVRYTSGGVYALSGNYASDYIPVKPLYKYVLYNIQKSWSDTRGLAFYNADKNYIGGIQYTSNSALVITAPEGAHYMRVTVDGTDVPSARIYLIQQSELTDNLRYEDYLINTLCIGDSLTVGADYTTGSYGGNMKENYPYYLARMTKINVDYVAHAGDSAQRWWNSFGESTNYSRYDSFIIWLGVNEGLTDTLDTDVEPYTDYHDYASTNTGCYCKIIKKIIDTVPNARIFLGTTTGDSSTSATTDEVIYDVAEMYSNNVVGVVNNADGILWSVGVTDLYHPNNGLHFSKVGNMHLANHWLCGIRQLIYRREKMFNVLVKGHGA